MVNQILFLLCFISASCTNSSKENSQKDTIKIINEIKKQFAEINSKAASYRKVEKDIPGQSAEGGIIIGYYDKTNLKKIITTYYGETGKALTEYYFNSDGLFFAFKIEYLYDKPIYEKGSKIISVEENRFYFIKNTLLKWLDKNKNSVSPNAKEYQQEAKYFKEDIENFKKMLRDYKPN